MEFGIFNSLYCPHQAVEASPDPELVEQLPCGRLVERHAREDLLLEDIADARHIVHKTLILKVP